MPDRLLSPRLILCPASPAELTAAATRLGFPADPVPDDLAPGWLMKRKRDGDLAGLVSARTQLTCIVAAQSRRRGYAGEALARLVLEGGLPSELARPHSAAACDLLAKIGYRLDPDRAELSDAAVAQCTSAFERDWRASHRRRVEELHARLAIPTDYASRQGLEPVAEALRLRSIGRDPFDREQFLAPEAAEAWARMQTAAADESVAMHPISAYRGLDYQAELLERKLAAGNAVEDVLRVSAAPGFSEHHSGLALDLGAPDSPPLEVAFEQTPAFTWLSRRATEFGFHLSYPRDNPHGIAYEPWHWAWRP